MEEKQNQYRQLSHLFQSLYEHAQNQELKQVLSLEEDKNTDQEIGSLLKTEVDEISDENQNNNSMNLDKKLLFKPFLKHAHSCQNHNFIEEMKLFK